MTDFLEQQGLALLPFSAPKKRQDLKGEWPHGELKRGWILLDHETANLSKDTPSPMSKGGAEAADTSYYKRPVHLHDKHISMDKRQRACPESSGLHDLLGLSTTLAEGGPLKTTSESEFLASWKSGRLRADSICCRDIKKCDVFAPGQCGPNFTASILIWHSW